MASDPHEGRDTGFVVDGPEVVMADDHAMWTPLERALAPFKSLARLNRQSVNVAGEFRQLRLDPERCRVEPGADAGDASHVELAFSVETARYQVRVCSTDYSQDGTWNLDRLRADLSAALTSGALAPDTPSALSPSVAPNA